MPTGTASIPLAQARPDSPVSKRTSGQPDAPPSPPQSCHVLELLFSPPEPQTATPSTEDDYDAKTVVTRDGDAEDEYTFTAYGDVSLSEVIVPPLPAPAGQSTGPLEPGIPRPRLRLKVRRPPMPRNRMSFSYVPDPMPHSGGLEPDERWPGSPRPTNNPPWLLPLVSPLSADPPSPLNQGDESVKKKSGSSLEKLFDEISPRSPSIRLSPPGSPASQALSLPDETRDRRSKAPQDRKPLRASNAKPPQSSPAPAPQQGKSKPWRTRLPPRLPIPKWDI